MNRRYTLIIALTLAFQTGLIGCSATPVQESTGEFLDSSLITAKVKTKLIDDRITGGFQISVYTFKGVVHLSGIVNSDYEKDYASKIARDVNGVKHVENKLVVRSD
jgi:osmotically-inducible protein OsmY